MSRCMLLGAMCLALAPLAQAADLNLVGGWFETLGAADLVAGAGSDLRSPITSGSSQATLDIANTDGAPWTIGVRRSSSSLPGGVALAVRRTTSGSGDGHVSGGEGYVTVGTSEQVLCSGEGDLDGIGLQLRLSGVSVEQGAGTFGATLTYRIY